jgi:uncharacterized protein DUF4156
MLDPRWAYSLASALFIAGCAAPRPPAQLSKQGSVVRVGKERPSPGARELGPVEGESGNGCAGFGTIGTYDTAEADLRNRTAAMGGDYAVIVTVLPPHDTGTQCPDNRMILRGVAYKTVAPAAVSSAPVLSGPPAAPAPSGLSAPAAPSTTLCDPPCSPGYTCEAGSCVALCNPPCGPGQVCRADRLCVPGG